MMTLIACVILSNSKLYESIPRKMRLTTATLMTSLVMLSCGPTLNKDDIKHLDRTKDSINDCQDKGREAGVYQVYDDCMKDAGLRK